MTDIFNTYMDELEARHACKNLHTLASGSPAASLYLCLTCDEDQWFTSYNAMAEWSMDHEDHVKLCGDCFISCDWPQEYMDDDTSLKLITARYNRIQFYDNA